MWIMCPPSPSKPCGSNLLALSVLRFYGPVNPMGSCRAWSLWAYICTREDSNQPVHPYTVLQLGFQGRRVPDRALFARSYKNEGTSFHVMSLVLTLGKFKTTCWNIFSYFSQKTGFGISCKLSPIFFPENRIWHFMQIVSIGDNLHEMSNPVFWEKWRQFAWNVKSCFLGKIRKVSSICHLLN